MATIIWTREAELWLRDIYDYVSQDNPSAAADVVSGVYQRVQILASHPEIGHRYRYERAAARNIRILLYGHYRIAYLTKRKRWRASDILRGLRLLRRQLSLGAELWT